MFAQFFKMPTYSNVSDLWSEFMSDRLFATAKIVRYEYTKRFTKVGRFEMVLPFDKDFISVLELNGTIYYDNDWLWIQSIQYDGKTITLSGTDMKGLLETRVSLYADQHIDGGQGYDIATGTTKACIKHYLDGNAVSPSNVKRILPIISTVSGTDGLSEDSYMARLEVLSDIIGNLCENAGIGYDVAGRPSSWCFQVSTIEGTNRSHDQTNVTPIVFAVSHRNVRSLTCEHGVSDLYNEVYAVDSNEIVKMVNRNQELDEHGEPKQVARMLRRECTVTVGTSSTGDDADYFDKYVLREVADNVESHSFTIEPTVSGYGTEYALGDYVTILDDFTGNLYKRQITEVTKTYSAGQQSLSLVFGIPKQKPLQKLVNSFISGTARRR